MRGQVKNIKSIILSGNVYLKDYDENYIPKSGDIILYIHNEEELYPVVLNEYKIKGYKGYFKVKVFDGKTWCMLDNLDFFEDRLNQFSKSEISFYTANLCKERLESYIGTHVYRTYREHYSLVKFQQNEYKGKKTILHSSSKEKKL